MIDQNNTIPALGQAAVDSYFTFETPFWRDVYELNGLEGNIYRDRQAAVVRSLEALRIPPGRRVLEIGCGAGSLTCDLARKGYRVTAVDTVQSMLRTTRDRLAREGFSDRAVVIAGDAHDLPFPSQAFDLVVAVGVVPWLHSPRKALLEIRRVLTANGHIVITSDNRLRLSRILDPRISPVLDGVRERAKSFLVGAGLWKHGSRVSATMLTPGEFEGSLNSTGFVVEESYTVGFGPFTFFQRSVFPDGLQVKCNATLTRLAASGSHLLRFCGNHHIVVAQPNAASTLDTDQGTTISQERSMTP